MYLKDLATLLANRKPLILIPFFLVIAVVAIAVIEMVFVDLPSQPNVMLSLAFGLLFACFASLGVVFAFEYLRDRVERKLGIEDLVGLPVSPKSCWD